LVNVGRELGVAEKYKEAALIFQKAYEADPFDPSAKYEEGLTRLYLEEYEQALECFKKVLGLLFFIPLALADCACSSR
jgi:tetratricopeptide (TPR) repeat protein